MAVSMDIETPVDRMITVTVSVTLPESILGRWAQQNSLVGQLASALRAELNNDETVYKNLQDITGKKW